MPEDPFPSWNAGDWLRRFHRASCGHGGSRRRLRREVYEGTVAAVRERGYTVAGRRIDLDAEGRLERLRRDTVFYAETDSLGVPEERRGAYATAVRVVDADCLDAARAIAAPDGPPPAVLNMASRRNPGGGVVQGSGAQEETLFRRTDLLHSLYQFVPWGEEDYGVPPHGVAYPIPRESGGIYSPGAWVFRSAASTGYAFLARPYPVAFVTVPAIHDPERHLGKDGRLWLTDAMAEATRRKIRAIFRIAAHHGHLDLVLSAFGCGAFRNPPHHLARLFREVLAEAETAGAFRRVLFAVLDDHNAFRADSPLGNFTAFERELGGL